ncbi:MAG TPA: biotin/lipoyl-containing protein [Candidatus Limnocylindria bacterium]|nr:biotin/lipoyl-containing protein [Candidatus Limnocylindria bacterium]
MADDAVLRALDILTPVFETSGLEELEVEAGEIQVRLARAVAPSTAAPLSAAAPAPPLAATPPTSVSPFGEPAPGRRFVTAPLTGVWYGAPSPGARPYLAVDAEVSVGQVVGLIEAMKLFNEIKSDIAGKVTRILVESGTLVKRQQPILEVDPS